MLEIFASADDFYLVWLHRTNCSHSMQFWEGSCSECRRCRLCKVWKSKLNLCFRC